jgi:hypothetical protein
MAPAMAECKAAAALSVVSGSTGLFRLDRAGRLTLDGGNSPALSPGRFGQDPMAKTPLLPHEIHYTETDAILSAVGATLLIVSEMLGAIFAFAWAVGGLLGLGEEFRFITMAVCAVPGLWLSASMTRRILRVEKKLRTIIPE